MTIDLNGNERLEIAVGIVVYNTSIETLEASLASLNKAEPRLQSIILLCNSPDRNYQDKIVSVSRRYNCTLIPNQPNRGFGAGHNTIVKTIKADWYVCCNPDIIVIPGAIHRLVRFGGMTSDSILIGPRILNTDGSNQALSRRHITLFNWVHRQLWRIFPKFFKPAEIRFNYELSQEIEFVSGSFFAVRTIHYRVLGGFSEDYFLYCEDADLARRASELGTNYYVADAVVIHSWSKAWQHSWHHTWHEIKSLLRYFRKFGFL